MTTRRPNDASLNVSDLPSRPRRLRIDEMKDVFGGCSELYDRCTTNSDCCGDLLCKSQSSLASVCHK